MELNQIARSPLLALAPCDDGYLAFDLKSRQLHRLNATAALLLELSDGTSSAAAICDRVIPHLDGSADTCLRWIEFATGEGWLHPTAGEAPSPGRFSKAALQLRNQGEVLAAWVCQEYATALQPDSSNWFALAELAHITGRRERAHEAYGAYLRFKPDDAEVLQIVRALSDEPAPPRAPDAYVTQLYARFAGFYEKSMREELVYQGPVLIEEMLDEFLGDAAGLDILELGCGTGLAGRLLRRRARSLIGIDLSADMIAIAQTSGIYDELVIAEITAWIANNQLKYHLVVACDTLIYFGDLRQVVVPAAQHLLSGGWLALTVEKGDTPPFRLTDSGRYSHTEQHIREVAQDAGLAVISVAEDFLRNEYGRAVTGLIVLLQRP